MRLSAETEKGRVYVRRGQSKLLGAWENLRNSDPEEPEPKMGPSTLPCPVPPVISLLRVWPLE